MGPRVGGGVDSGADPRVGGGVGPGVSSGGGSKGWDPRVVLGLVQGWVQGWVQGQIHGPGMVQGARIDLGSKGRFEVQWRSRIQGYIEHLRMGDPVCAERIQRKIQKQRRNQDLGSMRVCHKWWNQQRKQCNIPSHFAQYKGLVPLDPPCEYGKVINKAGVFRLDTAAGGHVEN